MYIQIDERIYKWLLSLDVLKPEGRQQKKSSSIELSLQTSLNLESGVLFAKLLRNLLSKTQTSSKTLPLPTLDTLKEFSTPTSRLYNWNVLTEAYKNIDIEIKPDMKSLIVAGDRGCVVDFLREIYTKIVKGAAEEKTYQEFEDFDELALDSSNYVGKSFVLNENKKKGIDPCSIDLKKVHIDSLPEKAETLLEFFIICVGKHMSLSTKQAASLFTKGSKYMAHVVIKGLKGSFESVITYLQEVYGNLDHVLVLLEADVNKSTLPFSLQALKPGLVSKSMEVAQWTLRIFSSLSFEFLKRNLHAACWEWFIGEAKGFLSFLRCLKRHPDLKTELLGVLMQIGRYNFLEMLTSLLKKALPDPKDFFFTVSQLMKPIADNKSLREDLINSGVLEYWLEYAHSASEESVSNDARMEILGFFTEVWVSYADKIEEKEEKVNRIIDLLKKAAGDERNISVKLIAITHLFRLLENFGNSKKAFAPTLFKTLTMILLENHAILDIREFMIKNFINIFEEFPNIPISSLFEPLMKQIQISENTTYILNVSDFQLFIFFSKADGLGIKNSIQLLDFLAKIFLNQIIWGQICSLPMITLILKHKNNETMQEFILKFVKICLAMLYASERKKKANQPQNPNLNISLVKTTASHEKEVINSQKRALIVEILRQITSIGSSSLTQKIKPLIAHTCLQIKDFSKKCHKGLFLILSTFGNAEELLEQYEKDYLQSLNEKQEQMNTSSSNTMDKIRSPKSETISKKGKNLSSLTTNFVDPKALKAIEETKQNFKMKITGKIKAETESQKLIEKQKTHLRKQLEIRSIQHGIGVQNQKDLEVNLIFEEGSLKSQDFLEFEDIKLVNLELEEERDKLLVDEFIRKNHKVFKYLFLKYANSGYWTKQETFSKISDSKSQKINVSELVKLFKDHGYDSLVKNENINSIIKGMSFLATGNKSSFLTLDFQQFQEFFLQTAYIMHSKEFHGGPINLSMEKMLENFHEEEKKQGLNVAIFEDPLVNFIYDRSVIIEINKNLQENPNYVLPEGFKKYHEKRVKFEFTFPESLNVPENYIISYRIVNEIILENFGINLIEPFASFTSLTLAKPKLNHIEAPPLKVYETKKFISVADEHLAKIEEKKKYKFVDEPSKEKHRVLEITRKRGLSLEMKLHIASCDQRFKYITEECAYVLEDMIDAVSLRKSTIELIGKNKNKAILSKKELEKIIEDENEEKEKLRRIRHEQIKREIKEKGGDVKKNPYVKEDERKFRAEEERSKKVWDVRFKENKELKKKVKEYRKSKSEEREEKKKEEEIRIQEIKRQKEKEFEEFNKKNKEIMQEKFKKALESRELEKKNKEEKEKLAKKKWKEYNEKILPEKFKKESKMHHLEQGINQQIKSFFEESSFCLFLEKYKDILNILFEYLIKRTFVPLNFTGEPATISLEGLSHFAADFNLSPSIFSLREIVLIYKSLTKLKPPVVIKDSVSPGINYQEFIEFLVRVAMKGQSVFNRIGVKIKESESILEQDLKKIIEKESFKKGSTRRSMENIKKDDFKGEKAILDRYKNVLDEYQEIEKTSILTLEGMFYYLGLPLDPCDKSYLVKKLKDISVKKSLPNKYKKKDLEKKLEDGIRYESPKIRNRSGREKNKGNYVKGEGKRSLGDQERERKEKKEVISENDEKYEKKSERHIEDENEKEREE